MLRGDSYKIGDKVLFNVGDKTNIWSGIITTLQNSRFDSSKILYSIQFDGVIHPDEILSYGPGGNNILNFISDKELIPRESQPDDERISLEWKEQLANKERLEKEQIKLEKEQKINEKILSLSLYIGKEILYNDLFQYEKDHWLPQTNKGEIILISQDHEQVTIRANNNVKMISIFDIIS